MCSRCKTRENAYFNRLGINNLTAAMAAAMGVKLDETLHGPVEKCDTCVTLYTK